MKIAFFGMGIMGRPMAARLAHAGHEISTVVHRDKSWTEQLLQQGIRIMRSPVQAVSGSEAIISILPDDSALEKVFLGRDMHDAVPPGALFIEMSSASPAVAKKLMACYADKSVDFLDAPVTGGRDGAAQGTLKIIGGGSEQSFLRASPILEVLSSRIYRVGAVGDGKLVKAMTNLLGGVTALAVAEFTRQAVGHGLDLDVLYELGMDSSGSSIQFLRRYSKMIHGSFLPPDFKLRHMRKDMETALNESKGMELPLSRLACRIYASDKHFDDEDMAAVCKIAAPLQAECLCDSFPSQAGLPIDHARDWEPCTIRDIKA